MLTPLIYDISNIFTCKNAYFTFFYKTKSIERKKCFYAKHYQDDGKAWIL